MEAKEAEREREVSESERRKREPREALDAHVELARCICGTGGDEVDVTAKELERCSGGGEAMPSVGGGGEAMPRVGRCIEACRAVEGWRTRRPMVPDPATCLTFSPTSCFVHPAVD